MDLRGKLYRVYWRIQDVVLPKLKHSQQIYADTLQSLVASGTAWLDLGCGHQLFPDWLCEAEENLVKRCRLLVGTDYDHDALHNHKTIAMKVRSDISSLPFREASFDIATANMVVEHLDRPDVQFAEIARILKPGGLLIFLTPNRLGYTTLLARMTPALLKRRMARLLEARHEEDVYKTHYLANSPSAIKNLAAKSGFEVADVRMIVSSPGFMLIPPIALLELLWLRVLMTKPFRSYRTNIIAVLRKREIATSVKG